MYKLNVFRSAEFKVLIAVIKIAPLAIYYIIHDFIIQFFPAHYRQKNISGQTVLITGAGSGIGKETAIEFAKHGVTLVLVDLKREFLFGTEKLLDQSSKAYLYECDVSNPEKVYEFAKLVKSHVGKVDILINNAGIVTGKMFQDLPDELIIKTMQVNTLAHFWLIKSFLPDMKTSNSGHIVSIASQAGLIGLPKLTDYCASKFGAVGLMESLRIELDSQGMDGIKTTLICPNLVQTGLFEGSQTTLSSMLKPNDVALEILSGVLENKEMVIIPRWCTFFFMFKWAVPFIVTRKFCEEVGIWSFMSNFTGRVDKDKSTEIIVQ